MQPQRRTAVLVALVPAMIFAGATGCRTSSAIDPGELRRLDGYQAAGAGAPPNQELKTLSGDRVVFTRGSDLYLGLPEVELGGRFSSIQVRNGAFDGVTTDGERIQAPLEEIRAARVDNLSSVQTAAAVVGGVLVVALLVGGYLLVSADQTVSVEGRALRLRRRATLASSVATSAWTVDHIRPNVAALAGEARIAIGEAWLAAARGEHASIPAFSRLSLTLVALGAPAHLVARVHRAALEEVEHARLSFALASAYLGEPVSAGPLPELQDAPAVTATTIVDLAEESLLEGCLLEGTAAAVAEAALARATDPAVRSVVEIIAREEASHVDLAWQIVRWCCDTAGPKLADDLRSVAGRPRAVKVPFEVARRFTRELAAHGRVDAETWRDAYEATRALAVARLEESGRGFRG